MNRIVALEPRFVTSVPEVLEGGVLYISMEYGMAAHKCCCGCDNDIFTPITPTDWNILYDGKAVSLYPSIGNWNLPCRSHYWIKRNAIEWSYQMSPAQIKAGADYDRRLKDLYYGEGKAAAPERPARPTRSVPNTDKPAEAGSLEWVKALWSGPKKP